MADNPFEDDDVQAAVNSDNSGLPAPNQNVYGNADNAYDDAPAANNVNVDMVQAAAAYIPEEQKKAIAMQAGSAMANQAKSQVAADYNKASQTQGDQNAPPPPPGFCIKLYYWFPLRAFSFLGGCWLIASIILELIFGSKSFISFFIYIYLLIFGVTTLFVESPTFGCTRFFQLKIFFWFRLLSRMWGRAWFYLFASILCYAPSQGDGNGGTFLIIAGIWLTIMSICSFVFARMAGKKFQRMREFIAGGSEGDEMEGRFLRKFDELDVAGNGSIGSTELHKLAEMASRQLSNSERHAIQTFLDESCNGHVSKEDFMRQFVTQYQEKGFNQKYL